MNSLIQTQTDERCHGRIQGRFGRSLPIISAINIALWQGSSTECCIWRTAFSSALQQVLQDAGWEVQWGGSKVSVSRLALPSVFWGICPRTEQRHLRGVRAQISPCICCVAQRAVPTPALVLPSGMSLSAVCFLGALLAEPGCAVMPTGAGMSTGEGCHTAQLISHTARKHPSSVCNPIESSWEMQKGKHWSMFKTF